MKSMFPLFGSTSNTLPQSTRFLTSERRARFEKLGVEFVRIHLLLRRYSVEESAAAYAWLEEQRRDHKRIGKTLVWLMAALAIANVYVLLHMVM